MPYQCNLLFFDLSGGEIMLIVIMILLLFGSKRIPEFARALGKGMNEFKRAAGEIQKEIQADGLAKETREIKKEIDDIKKDIAKPVDEAGKSITGNF